MSIPPPRPDEPEVDRVTRGLAVALILVVVLLIVYAAVAEVALGAGARGPVAVASWYDDSGATACGIHARDGVASRTLPCGSRVRLCAVRCVTATVQDRGPFIAGRLFDLNATLKADLGCGDLCAVHWTTRIRPPRPWLSMARGRHLIRAYARRVTVEGGTVTVARCWRLGPHGVACDVDLEFSLVSARQAPMPIVLDWVLKIVVGRPVQIA